LIRRAASLEAIADSGRQDTSQARKWSRLSGLNRRPSVYDTAYPTGYEGRSRFKSSKTFKIGRFSGHLWQEFLDRPQRGDEAS